MSAEIQEELKSLLKEINLSINGVHAEAEYWGIDVYGMIRMLLIKAEILIALIKTDEMFQRPINTNHVCEDYYDEETLNKVYDVLSNVQSITYGAEEIVGMLQNEGILFRERRK